MASHGPEQPTLCVLLKMSEKKFPTLPPQAGLELGQAPCHELAQLWARSRPELPLKFGVPDGPRSELCLGD